MSINQILLDKEKPWLNVRFNNVKVDGSFTLDNAEFIKFNSLTNSIKATNEVGSSEPANSINLLGEIGPGGFGSINIGNNNLINGNNSISIGEFNNVLSNSAVCIGLNNDTNLNGISVGANNSTNNSDECILYGNTNSLNDCTDDIVSVGRLNNIIKAGFNSCFYGNRNNFEALNTRNQQCLIGNNNNLGDETLNIAEKNIILGNDNDVNNTVGTGQTDSNLVFGNDNETQGGGNILIGNGISSNENDVIRLGGSNITKTYCQLASGTGKEVVYDDVTGELKYINAVVPVFPPFFSDTFIINSIGVINITGVPFRPRYVEILYVSDLVNFNTAFSSIGKANDFNSSVTYSNQGGTSGNLITALNTVINVENITPSLEVDASFDNFNSDGFTITINNFVNTGASDPQFLFFVSG